MLDTDLDIDTETSGGSFLGDLGPPIRRYPYKGVRQFLDTLEMELRHQEEEFDASEWVLFANINRQAFSRDFRIALESWKLVGDRVKRQQQIEVHKGENKHVYARGHPLVLSFSDVFLRPASLARETDIIFDDHIMKKFAEMVWRAQEF